MTTWIFLGGMTVGATIMNIVWLVAMTRHFGRATTSARNGEP